ncbi:MAG: septum formation initiator family protein [Gemmatimonadota bacterium]
MALEPRRVVARGVGLLVLGVAAYYAIWGGEYTLFDLGRLGEAQRVEAARLAEARAAADSLNALIDRLEDDPATIEAVAREQFGMIREGEVIYRFVDIEGDGQDPAAP